VARGLPSLAIFRDPLQAFGLVALLYYAALHRLASRSSGPLECALLASASGFLGSLWWWIEIEAWYFSLIHGSIWGVLVGSATAHVLRARTPA
jgi:hypothetical protein